MKAPAGSTTSEPNAYAHKSAPRAHPATSAVNLSTTTHTT